MKNIFLVLCCMGSVYAQSLTIPAGKKKLFDSPKVSDGKFIYSYYGTDNKTIQYSSIDIDSWTFRQEGVTRDELINPVRVNADYLTEIKNNTLYVYDNQYQVVANHEFTVPEKYSLGYCSFANDPENNQIVFFVVVGTNNYGWSKDDKKGYFLYLNTESMELEVKEIEAQTKEVSIEGFLSSEVIDHKVVMSIYAKGVKWGILDLTTGDFLPINFDQDASYFSYHVVTMNHQNYFIFRGGSSTSKSIYYTYDKVFKIDMGTGQASYIATLGNTNNSEENIGSGSFKNPDMLRLNCRFIKLGPNKYVHFSMYDEKVRVLVIEGEEFTYIETPTIKMSNLYSIYYQFKDDRLLLAVDGSKQIKASIRQYEVDLDQVQFIGEESISGLGGFRYFSTNDYYTTSQKDLFFNYNITKDKKTGIVTLEKLTQ